MPPRTFFFAGNAAPAYHLAKLIIKFINHLAGTIDGDPALRGWLQVVFLPECNVSLTEPLIPASDVSNQISTAGYEASGTSNMKFMMNGALTIRIMNRRSSIQCILDAVQAAGWPTRIPDPIPGGQNADQVRQIIFSLKEGLWAPWTA
jgi:hypothetical protein